MVTDLCIYGGTAAGVVAAMTAAKLKRSVVLIEPGRHLGGMTSGGLGFTDIGNKAAIGGISRRVLSPGRQALRQGRAVDVRAPRGRADFPDWIAEAGVKVLLEHRLVEARQGRPAHPSDHARKRRRPIRPMLRASKTFEEHVPVDAAMFIDATYEGDLMARAKVLHRRPRSRSRNTANRSTASARHAQAPVPRSGRSVSKARRSIERPAPAHSGRRRRHARRGRQPRPSLQLPPLPLPQPRRTASRSAPPRLRSENLRNPRPPPRRPRRRQQADQPRHAPEDRPMPQDKTDINNNGAVSTDFLGESWTYPDGDLRRRADRSGTSTCRYTGACSTSSPPTRTCRPTCARKCKQLGLCQGRIHRHRRLAAPDVYPRSPPDGRPLRDDPGRVPAQTDGR